MPQTYQRSQSHPMPIASRFTVWLLVLPLALVLTIAFSSPLASASASSQASSGGLALQVNAGFSAYYRNGSWVPFYITVSNNGPDFSGTLLTSNPESSIWQDTFTMIPSSNYHEPITVSHGTQKQFTMYLPMSSSFGAANILMQLLDSHGNVVRSQNAMLHQLNPEDVFVGLLSNQTTGFDPLRSLALPNQNGSVLIQFLNAQTLPAMAAVLANFNLIVLDTFATSSLTHEQLRALQIWVQQGGTLIEIGGPQWQQTLDSLPAGLLPVKIYGTSILPAGTQLLPAGGPAASSSGIPVSSGKLQKPVTVSTATVMAGARTILSDGTIPLIVQAGAGQGLIYYLAYDPTLEPIVDWPGAASLWKGLIIRSLGEQLLPQGFSPGLSAGIPYYLAKLQHLLLSNPVPAPWILLLLFLSYLAILGPVGWLIMRRTKRQHWGWRIALSTIITFSLLNYTVALSQQGDSMFGNSLSIIQLAHGGSFAHSTTYLGVYVPFVSADKNIQVHLPDGMLVQPFVGSALQQEPVNITATSDGMQVDITDTTIRELDALQTEQDLSLQGSIISHLVLGQEILTGTVTNMFHTALSDVYVLMPHSYARIGNLGPGQTSTVRLPLPLLSSNEGLPQCESLVNQLVANNTGIRTEYDHLFSRGFPQSLSERQRHLNLLAFLLTALQCSDPPLAATGSSATLIGWANQPLDGVHAVTFNGIHPGGLHETALLAPLDITYSVGPVTLPSDMLPGRLVDIEAQGIRLLSPASYALAGGQVTFEYSVPTSEHFHVQKITFSEPADSSIPSNLGPGSPFSSTAHISLYNWQRSSWDAIKLTQSTSYTTQNAKAYLGPDRRILMQYVNQASGFNEIAFTKPSLTLTGIVTR